MRRQENKGKIGKIAKSQKEIIDLSSHSGGYRVRVGLRAGDWQCNSCSGKTMGSQLFKAHCGYCIKQ